MMEEIGFAGEREPSRKTNLMKSLPNGNGRNGVKTERSVTITIVFLQESDDLLQHGGLVHLPRVARQHGAELFDENIELVPTFLLRLVSRSSVNAKYTGYWNIPLLEAFLTGRRHFRSECVLLGSSNQNFSKKETCAIFPS